MSFPKIFRWPRKRRELERKGPASKKKRRTTDTTIQKVKRPVVSRLLPSLVLMVVWLVCVFTILYQAPRSPFPGPSGMEAPSNYTAQLRFSYEDNALTDEARQRRAQSVLDYYRLDTSKKEQTLEAVDRVFAALRKLDPATAASEQAERDDPVDQLLADMPADHLRVLKQVFGNAERRELFRRQLEEALNIGIVEPDKEWITDRTERIVVVDQHNRKPLDEDRAGISTADLLTPHQAAERAFDAVRDTLRGADEPRFVHDWFAQPFAELIQPNLAFDAELRREASQKAMDSVPPEMREVEKGTIFIRRGTVITDQDLLKLKAHADALEASRDIQKEMKQDLQLLAISLLVLIICAVYIKHQHPAIAKRKLSVLMLGSIVSVHVLLMWGAEELMLYFQVGQPFFVHPALPLTLTPLLIALLLGKREGLSAAFLIPPLLVIIGDKPHDVLILGIVTSVIGVLAIYKSRTRIHTFRAAIWIVIGGFLVESIMLLQQGQNWQFVPVLLGIMVASAFLTVLIVNLLLPVCEFLFRVTTNISLLELSDLNHPLLKRLQLEAPGTYHHTLMVATLAEHAAEAVGANTLLTRVSAYFHDIGKLANPSYFTENSFGQNRHEELSPRMSSMVILNHVKEGLAMAQKYKLREPLREAIATHHGTSLVYFFYRRALDNNQIQDAGDEESYRYPGPAPQSREASIISIADACEAASRSLEKPTPQKIDTQVDEIFHNKLRDGQLDDSQLSMSELKLVVETIKKTLHTMLHGRVAYPKFADVESGEPTKKVATRKERAPGQRPESIDDTKPLDRAELDGETDAEPDAQPVGGTTTVLDQHLPDRDTDRKEANQPGQ